MYLFQLLTTKLTAQEIRAFELGEFLGGRQRDRLRPDDRRPARRPAPAAARSRSAASSSPACSPAARWPSSSCSSPPGACRCRRPARPPAAWSCSPAACAASPAVAGGLYESSLYLEDFVDVRRRDAQRLEAARPTAPAPGRPAGRRGRRLRFTYPSRTEPSLHDVSITLAPRRGRRAGRRERLGQDDAGQAAGRPLHARGGHDQLGRRRRRRARPGEHPQQRRGHLPGLHPLP